MISITLQCSCGQAFVFDVEPVDGQMPCTVACPTCGLDATHAGNQEIQRQFGHSAPSAPVAPPAPPAPSASAPPKENNTLMIVGLCVAILVLVGLVGGAYFWVNSRGEATTSQQPAAAPAAPSAATAPSATNAPAAPTAPTTPEVPSGPAVPTGPTAIGAAKPANGKRDPSHVAVGALFDRDLKTQNVEITRVLPKSPAQKAGIVVGDVLVKVDGTPIQQMKLKEIADMFYGPVGTKLTLDLVSANGQTNHVAIVRKKFH